MELCIVLVGPHYYVIVSHIFGSCKRTDWLVFIKDGKPSKMLSK